MSIGTLGLTISELRAVWYERSDQGGLDQLHDVLRDHLARLERWQLLAKGGGVECSHRTRELKTRLKELADVHRELAEFLPGAELDPPPAVRVGQ